MANLSKVIYINEVDYSTLLNGGTITKGGVTYSHDPTALYVIKNVSAPEYAETAGYATTAGQATKATQDGDGNVIKDTYEKEQQVIIEFNGNDTTFPNLTDSEVRALCNNNSKTVILKDTSLRSQSTEGFPLYYRTEFTTDHWAFSSTYVEAAGAGWLIRLCWDQNQEAIVREFSDTKLYPSENVDLGQAYGVSSNNSNATRTSSISGFKLKRGGIVAIKFTTDIDITNPSLNISSTGSKPIYYRGSALPRGTVNAGDTVTFIYDGTYYHIISIDKDIPDPATTAPLMDGTASPGAANTTTYSKSDHVHPSDISRVPTSRKINNNPLSSDVTLTASDVGALPSSTVIPDELADLSDDSTHRLVTDAEKSTWNGKQDTLVSGTNIKTVDGESLLGLGNIDTTFIVEVTYDTDTDTWHASESSTSIYAAWENGRDIILTTDGYTLQLYYVDPTNAYFSSLISDVDAYYTIKINSNKIASLSMSSIPSLANNLTTTEPGQALDATQGRILKNMITAQQVRVGSVAGKLYRNNIGGTGNFSISGNSGCIPNLTAGTFLVSVYAKSSTQSYSFKFNFGSVSYNLSTTNGEINDTREITIPSDGTFSGSVLNGSVASGTILYVVMYNYLTPVSTVGIAAVTNRYSDLDGTPTNISSFTNNVGYVTSTAITDLTDIL